MNSTLIFYGSFLAVPVACWWLRRTLLRSGASTLPRALLFYLLPLIIYAALVAAAAASSVDGQWTWAGETMQVTRMLDFQNNLFLVGMVSFLFPAGYGMLGFGILGYTIFSARRATRGTAEHPIQSGSRKKTPD